MNTADIYDGMMRNMEFQARMMLDWMLYMIENIKDSQIK